MGVQVKLRTGESLKNLMARFRKRVELSRRVKPGKVKKDRYYKPGEKKCQQEWSRHFSARYYAGLEPEIRKLEHFHFASSAT